MALRSIEAVLPPDNLHFVGDGFSSAKTGQLMSVGRAVGHGLLNINAVAVVISSGNIRYRQDFEALLLHEFGRDGTHIAKALNRTR